jgi:hypothetical protein
LVEGGVGVDLDYPLEKRRSKTRRYESIAPKPPVRLKSVAPKSVTPRSGVPQENVAPKESVDQSVTPNRLRRLKPTTFPDPKWLPVVSKPQAKPSAFPAKGSIQADLLKDTEVGLDVIKKAIRADWWEWSAGSTLIVWRWPASFQCSWARDRMPTWIQGLLPLYKRWAKKPKTEDAVLLTPKFLTILKRGCVVVPLTPDEIKSLVDYLYVAKANDIRPVYNGQECGINAALWAPNFWLPMA